MTRRVRRTAGTLSAARLEVQSIVGERQKLRGNVKMQLIALADKGPLTEEEVFEHAAYYMSSNQSKAAMTLPEYTDMAQEEYNKIASREAGVNRWGVVVNYIDGSMDGFPIMELDELTDLIERGPDWNLIDTIELKLLERGLIGATKRV